MPKWLIWTRIAESYITLLAVILLSGCLGLPTLEPTPGPGQSIEVAPSPLALTTQPPTATTTDTPAIIEITGNVYVRDDGSKVIGWLYKGDHVQAACSGDWCQIISDSYNGYHFWRGCSSDNPERKSCQARQP